MEPGRPRPPLAGDGVLVESAYGRSPRPGLVVAARPGALSVELEGASFRRRRRVSVRWVDQLGVARCHGRVASADGVVVEIALESAPEIVYSREHLRAEVALPLTAWSLHEPTRLIEGQTVNLSAGGALLEAAGVPPAAEQLRLRLGLPDGPATLQAGVLRREGPDRVAVAFAGISDEDRDRIAALVLARYEPAALG